MSETFFILRKIINVNKSSSHVPLILVRLLSDMVYLKEFRKMCDTSILIKKPFQWEPNYLMWTDGQTDTIKLKVTFRNFAKPPEYRLTFRLFNHVIETADFAYNRALH